MLAQDAARAQGGKLPLEMLLAPALKHAREGYIVTRSQARLTADKLFELSVAPGFAETFLREAAAPAEGSTMTQAALAATLRHLALDGLEDFYRGDVGREIAADLDQIGSPVTRADLAGYQATLGEPLRLTVPAGTVYNTDAPTQGIASLMILALFARLRVTEPESFDHIHGLVEATKRALRTRDRVLTDPRHLAHPLERAAEAAGGLERGDHREGGKQAGEDDDVGGEGVRELPASVDAGIGELVM